jgi:CDP-paratose 2-epimerase
MRPKGISYRPPRSDTNAVGTINLLEAAQRFAPTSPFVHMSANKVYGDAPNKLPLVETEKRWEYARPEDYNGIHESMRIGSRWNV